MCTAPLIVLAGTPATAGASPSAHDPSARPRHRTRLPDVAVLHAADHDDPQHPPTQARRRHHGGIK